MTITQDSIAILLLCSHLARAEDDPRPLALREWNAVARTLQSAALRPRDLLAAASSGVLEDFDLEEPERIAGLLARLPALQQELERLAAKGIIPLTRADADYPSRYRERLKDSAPPVLFYAGESALLGQPGIAVVGSRRLDEAGMECAAYVGNACGVSGQVLYSGGAKGVDTISMDAALEARGSAVAVLADSLEGSVRKHQDALERGDLCLLTAQSPAAGFSVGAAMGRNRLIYTLADYAIVVASDAGKGGTWAGASEALRHAWLPVFVLAHEAMPEGNRQLLQKGALPFPHPFRQNPLGLSAWLGEAAGGFARPPDQLELF